MRLLTFLFAISSWTTLSAEAQEVPLGARAGFDLFSRICMNTDADAAAAAEVVGREGLTVGGVSDLPTTTRGSRRNPQVHLTGDRATGTVFRGVTDHGPAVVHLYTRTRGEDEGTEVSATCDLYMMGVSETDVTLLLPERARAEFRVAPIAFLTVGGRQFLMATSRIARESEYASYETLAYFSHEGSGVPNEGEQQ